MDLPAHGRKVAACARHCNGVNVGGVKLQDWHLGGNRNTNSSGSTTKIDYYAGLRTLREALPQQGHGLRNKQFGAPARDKDTRINSNAKTIKPGPANNKFERLAGNPAANPFREHFGTGCFG